MPVPGTEEMTAPSSTSGLSELEMPVFRSEACDIATATNGDPIFLVDTLKA